MNPISKQLRFGTLGELFVQLRLLQFDVQAAPPLKDSGNDLVAIRGEGLRVLQVKTTAGDVFRLPKRTRRKLFHALALVKLEGEDRNLHLDRSKIFILRKADIKKASYRVDELQKCELSSEVVEGLFP